MNQHTVSAIYDRFLTVAMLEGQPIRAVIGMATLETDKGFNGEPQTRIVVNFGGRNAPKPLKCNKTQASAIGKIAETQDYREWTGVEILMSEGETQQGKPTIVITAPPRSQLKTVQAPVEEELPETLPF